MNYIAVWSSIMVHAARNTKWHETPTPGYFIFNLWLIVSLWLAFRQLQWVILQYDYDVNTTVLKLLYSTNSKAQHYKANGHLSIDLFVFFDEKYHEIHKKHFALVQSHTFVQFPDLVTNSRQWCLSKRLYITSKTNSLDIKSNLFYVSLAIFQ